MFRNWLLGHENDDPQIAHLLDDIGEDIHVPWPMIKELHDTTAIDCETDVSNATNDAKDSSELNSSSRSSPYEARIRTYFLTSPNQPERVVDLLESTTTQAKILVGIHGAGHTSQTWCSFLSRFLRYDRIPHILLLDLPGHGSTEIGPRDGASDSLFIDHRPAEVYWHFEAVYQAVITTITKVIRKYLGEWEAGSRCPARVYLMGHSYGGALSMKIASMVAELPFHLQGVIVIDCIEETALKHLARMEKIVMEQPSTFHSIDDAVMWSLSEGKRIRNRSSALNSIPSQLKWDASESVYRWKARLDMSIPYWPSWFQGRSQEFLGATIPYKMVMISGPPDILGKELMIGLMMGRFQLKSFPHAGHTIHEDVPDEVARDIQALFQSIDKLDEINSKRNKSIT